MPVMTLDLDLATVFRYEFWADREALAALSRAGDRAPPRALAIMNHVLAAAHLWLTRLTGEKIKIDVWPSLSVAQMEERINTLSAVWQLWIAGAKSSDLDRDITYVNSLGESWTSKVRDIITHIPIHAAYHRGQVAVLLGQNQQKPAYTDFIHATRQRLI